MYYLDIPASEQMGLFTDEAVARMHYSQTHMPCALWDESRCIAEKDWVDIGVDADGNSILVLEDQETDGEEYICLDTEEVS